MLLCYPIQNVIKLIRGTKGGQDEISFYWHVFSSKLLRKIQLDLLTIKKK